MSGAFHGKSGGCARQTLDNTNLFCSCMNQGSSSEAGEQIPGPSSSVTKLVCSLALIPFSEIASERPAARPLRGPGRSGDHELQGFVCLLGELVLTMLLRLALNSCTQMVLLIQPLKWLVAQLPPCLASFKFC